MSFKKLDGFCPAYAEILSSNPAKTQRQLTSLADVLRQHAYCTGAPPTSINYHASLARAVPFAFLRAAGATGTALSITQQESVMSQDQPPEALQYMVDVGVPQEDVAWLQRIANTPSARFADAAARIRRIEEQAYQGLLSFSSVRQQPAYR